ncbi:acetyltransferase [Micromonospora sp. NPDC049559]|uniref:acetyltransferase n=1 Tax=Micromonospora sp. NPDC049559 TaxID=3155923 RepID=UPI00343C69AF
MSLDIVVVGCGGHGRETLAVIHAVNQGLAEPVWRVLGFVDDHPSELNRKRVQQLDLPYLGPIDRLRDLPEGTHVAVGIGDPRVRRTVSARIDAYRLPAANLVHPAAMVGADTVAGEGLLVFAGARVTTNVTLGRHVHLNQNVTVAHDCVLGDFVSVNPLAAVSGECRLEPGVMVGAGAVVLQRRRVGADATIGAAACVVRDVAAGAVVKGVPAR